MAYSALSNSYPRTATHQPTSSSMSMASMREFSRGPHENNSFLQQQGGVGKTSLVYHLAYMFAAKGVRTLAVDLDPQANLTAMFLPEHQLEFLWPEGDH